MSQDLIRKLLELPGVHGVDVASDGRITLYTDGTQYAEAYGVPVRCLKAEKAKTMELRTLLMSSDIRKERWRPIPGGVSGADIYNTAGTIACTVYKRGKPYLLSNSHIFEESGMPIVQPSPLDGGSREDIVAYTRSFTPIRINSVNEVDAAIAEPVVEVADNILDIGVVRGVEEAKAGMIVEKSGRDGYSQGRVISTSGTFKVGYEGRGEAIFKDVIITTGMAKPGASGSLGVRRVTKNAIGLLFAGSNMFTLYIPIARVLRTLGVKIGE
jgi:hypothetical protein